MLNAFGNLVYLYLIISFLSFQPKPVDEGIAADQPRKSEPVKSQQLDDTKVVEPIRSEPRPKRACVKPSRFNN